LASARLGRAQLIGCSVRRLAVFFYPLYNWFYETFVSSTTAYIATLWITFALLVGLIFSWKRWLVFTLVGIALIAVNSLAYSAAVVRSISVAQRPNWVAVLLLSVIGVVCVATYLQWRYGDPARRRG